VLDAEPAAKIGHVLQQLLLATRLRAMPMSSSALRSQMGEGSLV